MSRIAIGSPYYSGSGDYDQEYRLFYCGATQIPANILLKVIGSTAEKWKYIDPKCFAYQLYDGFLTQGEFYNLTNPLVDPAERRNEFFYRVLPSKGDQRDTLVRFYLCLLQSQVDQELPAELRRQALILSGVDSPVLIPGKSDSGALDAMVGKLKGKCVSLELVKSFAKSLNIAGNEIGEPPVQDLGIVCQIWMTKYPNECTQEGLVESLVGTKGLGRFASGIAEPTNPRDVQSFFYHLHHKWEDMAAFLGYTKNDLEEVITETDNTYQRQIAQFLTLFKMPDCGTRSIPILHRAAQLAGISRTRKRRPNSLGATRLPDTCSKGISLLEPYQGVSEEPKPKPRQNINAKQAATNASRKHKSAPAAEMSWVPSAMLQASPYMMEQAVSAAVQLLQLYPPPLPPPPPPWFIQMYNEQYYGHHQCDHPDTNYWAAVHASRRSYHEWQQRQEMQESTSDMCESDNDDLQSEAATPVRALPNSNEGVPPQGEHVPLEGPASECMPNSQKEYEYTRSNSNDLIKHCRKGDPNDVEIVASLLESGASLKVQAEEDGSHPLHLAVLSKSLQMLQLLVSYYSSLRLIDIPRDDHKTALMVACIAKIHNFVRLLIDNGANVNTKDCYGFSPLHLKQTLECPDTVQQLVDSGAIVDIPADGNELTPLTHACFLGVTDSVKVLLNAGANPNAIAEAACTPLCAAAGAGYEQIVGLLLEKGAGINNQDKDGFSALLRACVGGHTNIASKLISKGADKDLTDKAGNTPVLIAVEANNPELLQLLLAYGANVNHFKIVTSGDPPQEYEITPLALAAGRGKLDMVEFLVENKANVNYCSSRTVAALSYAVGSHHAHVVEYFLKVNEIVKTIDGLAVPLIMSVNSNDQYITMILLDVLGGYEKALHQATEAGSRELIEVLLKLDDKGKPRRLSERATGGAENSLSLSLDPRELLGLADQKLTEFVKVAINTAEIKQGQQFIIDKARCNRHEHIVLFFDQYFTNPDAFPSVFGEFIRMPPLPSPAYFLFDDQQLFDGATCKEVLEQMGSDVMEYLPIALMQFPGIEEQICVDGDGLMTILFGLRFKSEVERFGLLKPAIPARDYTGATPVVPEGTHNDLDNDQCLPHSVQEVEAVSPTTQLPESRSAVFAAQTSTNEPSSNIVNSEDIKTPLFPKSPGANVHADSCTEEATSKQFSQRDQTSDLEHSPQHSSDSTPHLPQSRQVSQRGEDQASDLEHSDFSPRLPQDKKQVSPAQHRRPSRIPIPIRRLKSMPAPSSEGKILPAAAPYSASPHSDRKAFEFESNQKTLQAQKPAGHTSRYRNTKDRTRNERSEQFPSSRTRASYHSSEISEGIGGRGLHRKPLKVSKSELKVAEAFPSPSPQQVSRTVHASAKAQSERVCGLSFPSIPIKKPKELFKRFASRIGSCRMFGGYLLLDDKDIEKIENEHEFNGERCFQMLMHWYRREGPQATYLRLSKALYKAKLEHLVADLHSDIPENLPLANQSTDKVMEVDIGNQATLCEGVGNVSFLLFQKHCEGYKNAQIRIVFKK